VDANRARCRFDTRVDALRAVIAVQAYERENGSLPPSLEALVPGYLPAVPLDWLAGGSLRFERSARELTSFGFWDRKAYTEPREEHFPLLPAATSPGVAPTPDPRAERFRTARDTHG
jgi:hypothetical protein